MKDFSAAFRRAAGKQKSAIPADRLALFPGGDRSVWIDGKYARTNHGGVPERRKKKSARYFPAYSQAIKTLIETIDQTEEKKA